MGLVQHQTREDGLRCYCNKWNHVCAQCGGPIHFLGYPPVSNCVKHGDEPGLKKGPRMPPMGVQR